MSKDTNENDSVKEKSRSDSDIINGMFSRGAEKTLDTDSMILNTQKRVWAALKTGYEYQGVTNRSDQFLRKNAFAKINMAVLYVDLVGSTTMTLELPVEKLATIVSSFSQEMASTIQHHNGLVLKFVGDAVIGYFIAEENQLLASDNAVSCAQSMDNVIQNGINPVLNQYDYPELTAKIGLDFGQSIVMRYGSDPAESHIDLIGPAMNIAAKIQSRALPNQILIGQDVFQRLHPDMQKHFSEIVWPSNKWKYRSRNTGEIYKVFEYNRQ